MTLSILPVLVSGQPHITSTTILPGLPVSQGEGVLGDVASVAPGGDLVRGVGTSVMWGLPAVWVKGDACGSSVRGIEGIHMAKVKSFSV